MKRLLRHVTFLLAAAVCPALLAQVSTGTIAGTVTDPTGAVAANAPVLITNEATGIETQSTTSSAGFYSVPNLQTGTYTVAVTLPGFAPQEVKGIVLNVGAQQEIDVQLKVGTAAEKVVVTAASPAIDMVTSTTMPVVDERTIVTLPLNGRDWTQLANLQPGVAAVRTQSPVAVTNQRANRGVGNQLTVGGARPQQNNYRVDGISINDYSNGGPGGVIGSNLGVDAIQEFSVVTSNASADYGKTAGGIINAVTRSGTNKLHGSVYEFLRNSALDARNEFDAPGKIAEFRRNQFGASLGGPIIKDRTFIFGDYEGLRQYQGSNASSIVPTAAARNGQLVAGTVTVDPAIKPYLALYPLPTPGQPIKGDTGTFLFNDPFVTHENYYTVRLDHKISDKDSLTGTYFYDTGNLTSPDPFNVRLTGNVAKRQMATIGESHIFSANLLNSLKIGYSRVFSDAPTTLAAINPLAADTTLGFVPGLPVGLININGGISNFQGGLHATGEFKFTLDSYQIYDDAYLTKGKHAIKFGFAFERLQNNQLGTANPNGQYVFGSLSNFLTNQPTSFNAPLAQGVSPRDLRQSVFGGYINDNYRIANNLTLNLGVRYEPVTVPTETANRLANLVNLTDTAPHLGSPYFNNPSFKNIAPRVGFAWAPFGGETTSVHGGYGIYDAQMLNYLFEGLSIFTAPYLNIGNIATLPMGSFPKGAYNSIKAAPGGTLRYSHTDQNPARSYVQQYSLNVQQQLPYDMVLQVGYAGSRGTHLPYRVDDVNTVQPASTVGGYFFYGPNGKPATTPATFKLNPNVGQISAVFMTGYSHYNSLQTSLTKRLSHHTQFQVSYTWSKSIDDGSSSTFGDTFQNSVSSLPLWAPNRRRAISDFNVAQNIVANYLIELPNLHSGNMVTALVNGWQWGGIVQASTGEPLTPLIGGDPLGLHSNDAFAFPDRLTGPGCTGNPVNHDISPSNRQYINASCFAFPAVDPATGLTHLGTAGRNSIIGPKYVDVDTSLVKNTKVPRISENFNLQFRAELFNVLNHVNYGTLPKSNTFLFNQNGSVASSPGVLVGPTAGSSRQAQFALKAIF